MLYMRVMWDKEKKREKGGTWDYLDEEKKRIGTKTDEGFLQRDKKI